MQSSKLYALTLKKVRTLLAARGHDVEALLEGTDLTAADIDDPYRVISEDQARRYYRNAIAVADDPDLGLEVGWTTSVAELGPAGLVQLVAQNIHYLSDRKNKPIGGKWSFDSENRKKYPKSKSPPKVNYPSKNIYYIEAEKYIKSM